MKRLPHLFASLVLLALVGCATAPSEPRNLDWSKAEIRDYVKSGRYQGDIVAVAAKADAWLVERASHRAAGERTAVVFDLDETLLSNWPFMLEADLGGSDAAWDAWLSSAKSTSIEPIGEVYRTARRLGLEIYFITGRHERLRAATQRNLRAVDCIVSSALIMKPNDAKETAAAFKTAVRARLTSQGAVIVGNLGDQASDLAGGYAERTFKLPDPFYFTP